MIFETNMQRLQVCPHGHTADFSIPEELILLSKRKYGAYEICICWLDLSKIRLLVRYGNWISCTVDPLYNDTLYNSKILYNVSRRCTKFKITLILRSLQQQYSLTSHY